MILMSSRDSSTVNECEVWLRIQQPDPASALTVMSCSSIEAKPPLRYPCIKRVLSLPITVFMSIGVGVYVLQLIVGKKTHCLINAREYKIHAITINLFKTQSEYYFYLIQQ